MLNKLLSRNACAGILLLALSLCAGKAVAAIKPSPIVAAATQRMEYIGAVGSKVVVHGHSTLHNWSVTGRTLNGKLILAGHWTSQPTINIELLHVTIPVATLKGSDGSGMTDTVMHALHRKTHPDITFIVTHARPQPQNKHGIYLFRTAGLLKINGIMRKEYMTLQIVPHAHGLVTVNTRLTLKMRDFNVTPPTAMFGIIRAGNTIKIDASWHLSKAGQLAKSPAQ